MVARYTANSSFAFWNLLEFFFSEYFQSANAEPVDMQGQLYVWYLKRVLKFKQKHFFKFPPTEIASFYTYIWLL